MKLTGWYKGDQKPVRIGIYERISGQGSGCATVFKSYWDGSQFSIGFYNIDYVESIGFERFPKSTQHLPWRGIAK